MGIDGQAANAFAPGIVPRKAFAPIREAPVPKEGVQAPGA
jgi:hypothetical protein